MFVILACSDKAIIRLLLCFEPTTCRFQHILPSGKCWHPPCLFFMSCLCCFIAVYWFPPPVCYSQEPPYLIPACAQEGCWNIVSHLVLLRAPDSCLCSCSWSSPVLTLSFVTWLNCKCYPLVLCLLLSISADAHLVCS